MRIPPAVFRYIEHELYNYDQTRRELEHGREDIIHQAHQLAAGGGSSGPGDPTGSRAIKLVSTPTLMQMERVISAIDTALRMLGDEHCLMFELRYRQGLNWQAICRELPTSQATYFRLRRQLVETVGLNLGLLKDD